jgi:hypothetical protein
LLDPKEWSAIQKNISEGSSAKSSDKANHYNTDKVEVFSGGLNDSRECKGKNANRLKY